MPSIFSVDWRNEVNAELAGKMPTGVVPVASGGTGASTAAGARTNLGLGTAAVQNTGTSGANVPLLNGANTWTTTQIVGAFSATGASDGKSIGVSFLQSSRDTTANTSHEIFYNPNGLVGNITTSGTTTAYNTSSDYRRKPVREALSGFWTRLSAVIPRRFQWDTGEWASGFVAHEFAEVYPNSVAGEKDAVDEDGAPVYQSMQASTSEVMADIIAALQDIKARLDAAGI